MVALLFLLVMGGGSGPPKELSIAGVRVRVDATKAEVRKSFEGRAKVVEKPEGKWEILDEARPQQPELGSVEFRGEAVCSVSRRWDTGKESAAGALLALMNAVSDQENTWESLVERLRWREPDGSGDMLAIAAPAERERRVVAWVNGLRASNGQMAWILSIEETVGTCPRR